MTEELKRENEELRRSLQESRNRISVLESNLQQERPVSAFERECEKNQNVKALSIVILGASGDLAKKKTFPALFALYVHGLLPKHAVIVGYARSKLSNEEFRTEHVAKHFPCNKDHHKAEEFLRRCHYIAGEYDSAEHFEQLARLLERLESSEGRPTDANASAGANRIFYLAVPPSVFIPAAKAIHAKALAPQGWTRVVVEKPFGHDLGSSMELSRELGALFTEDQLYRIDHYLGKEMVQNLMVLRFANSIFEPLWNRNYIANVVITFKEDIGTEGRGGYFDKVGIVRDVMQNHLLQILSLVAMEAPVSLSAEDVRDEKVKVLRCIPPVTLDDIVLGQFGPDAAGKQQGYLDDPGVSKDSVTPTFALAVLRIKNTRWDGVPFILKCGKGLNERKTDVRIQFRPPPGVLFAGSTAPANELVMRVQPNEAVYLKLMSKTPGLTETLTQTELDLSYKSRFDSSAAPRYRIPDAYERLIYDVIRGDHNLFVRADELEAAWKIFTPLLHTLDQRRIKPIPYPFGTRGPIEADELARKQGFVRTENYSWPQPSPSLERPPK